MSNLFDNYNVKIIKEDKCVLITCQIHNNIFSYKIKQKTDRVKYIIKMVIYIMTMIGKMVNLLIG
jgi:hypothetical protein